MTRRIAGSVLVVVGAVGIALCTLGVIYTWRAAEEIIVLADESLLLISDALTEIDRSLDVASITLDEATVALDGLHTTSLDVSLTLSSTRVAVDEIAGLAQDELPQSIESSLVALDALEETAALIDQLLRGLQRLGLGSYDPAMPLDQAVAAAGTGLEAIPQSLRVMAAGLKQTSSSLGEVEAGILVMGDQVIGIRDEAVNADLALSDHRGTLREIQTRVENAREEVQEPIRIAAWGVTLLMVWVGLSQLAVVWWGVNLWQRRVS